MDAEDSYVLRIEGYYPNLWPGDRSSGPVDADACRPTDLGPAYGDLYAALQNDSLILATAGARILLDRAMVLLLGEDAGGFGKKLDEMAAKGIIGGEDRELLAVMTNVGSAASHRGHRPSREHLETILDTIKNLLHRKFVLQPAAAGVKAATPARGPRRRS